MNNNDNKSFDRNQYMPPSPAQAAPAVQPEAPQPIEPAGQVATSAPPEKPGFEKPKIPTPVIAGAIILVLILGIIGFVMSRNASSTNSANPNGTIPQAGSGQMKVIPTLDAAKPALSFVSVSDPSGYKVGDEITFQIKANSQGADVNGYDLLFPYDKDSIEILETKTAIDTFQIFAHDRNDYYAVTGLKLLSVTAATPFNDTPILEMKVKAKKAGTYYLEILPERGKETSKFVDKDIKIIQPQIQPVKLEIK